MAAHVVDPEVIGPGIRDVPATSNEADIDAIRLAIAKMRRVTPPETDAMARQAIVLVNRHCLSCHVLGPVGGTDGPDLTHVGEKLDPGVIERRIVNATNNPAAEVDAVVPFGIPESSEEHYKIMYDLIALASDVSAAPIMREEAVIALGRIGRTRAFEPLVALWSEAGPELRAALRLGLRKMARPAGGLDAKAQLADAPLDAERVFVG